MIKLNVLLAKTDMLASQFKGMINDFYSFFSNKQGEFKGEKKTYECNPGMVDLPSERGEKRVVSTVREKLDWIEDISKEYIDALFSQEATNASGNVRAELVIQGNSWGHFSSLELLRLKSLIENGELERMYQAIPVRSDSEVWKPTNDDSYRKREIYESTLLTGTKKSIIKEAYILPDPNISKDNGAKYVAQVSQKDTIIDLGNFTYQRFSGEWSHRERAELLKRRTALLLAVTEALKVANETESIKSGITSEKIFNYLHKGE